LLCSQTGRASPPPMRWAQEVARSLFARGDKFALKLIPESEAGLPRPVHSADWFVAPQGN
jgi:hypothetical protein